MAKTISGYGFDLKSDLILSRERKIQGARPTFGHIIVVSYSAFDNFEIPGKYYHEQSEVASHGHIYGYKYCGLRERTINGKYRLKDSHEISAEFSSAIEKIEKNNRAIKWGECLEPILTDPSFKNVDIQCIKTRFSKFSSGQKIILSIVTNIFEHIRDNSLVIIDEPETHLHPSLIAAFMHSIRRILKLSNSYAIIATHSPVVLQETPSKFVLVLKGSAEMPIVGRLNNESFGEEISTLTEEVFQVSFEESNFYSVLNELSQKGFTASEVDELFTRRLGITARSFLKSK